MLWAIFAVMLVAGVLVVAVPMVRHGSGFSLVPASAILVVVSIAAVVYSNIGSPTTETVKETLQGINDMVASLDERLQKDPDDPEGWKMLGRSYAQLERYDQAVRAYEQALARETGNKGQALADLGEVILLDAGGPVTGRAAELFDAAVAAAPGNAKALFYAGLGAAERGDNLLAAKRWETLLATSPPEDIQDVQAVIQERIAEWRGGAAVTPPAPQAATEGPLLSVAVSLDPAAAAAVADDATVFIIARDPERPSPPIAAVRRRVSELPDTVALGDADAMIPGRRLSAFRTVEIVARVSMSGQPIAQPGDWYGQATVDTGAGGTVAIAIDRVVE